MPVFDDARYNYSADIDGQEIDNATVTLLALHVAGPVAGEAQSTDHAVAHQCHLLEGDPQVGDSSAKLPSRTASPSRPLVTPDGQAVIDEIVR